MNTRRADRLLIAAFLFAMAVGLALAFVPAGTDSVSVSSEGPGVETITETSESLLDHEGPSVLLPLAVPAGLSGIALARRTRRATLTMASLCLVACFLGMMSIGLFFLPVPLVLFLAARWQRTPTVEQLAR